MMPGLTLDQLETFQSICRLGSFRAAADHLGITQPAVSLRIHQLEAECRATLFARRGTRVQLTATGSLVSGYAERSLGLVVELQTRLHAGDPWHGVLRLGSSALFAMTCLPAVLQSVERAHPDLDVELVATSSDALQRAIELGEVDIAFVASPDPVSDVVITAPVARTGLAVISNGELGLPATVQPADLLDHRVLVNPPPSPIHTETTRWFRRAGEPARHLSTCNGLPVTVELVRAGGGTGVVPVRLVRDLVRVGELSLHDTRPRMRALRQCLIHTAAVPSEISAFLLRAAKEAATAAGLAYSEPPGQRTLPVTARS